MSTSWRRRWPRGSDVLALEADLEQWESTEQAFAAGVAHFGRLDVVINNVGGTIWARPFAEYQPDQIEKEIRRSLFPTLWAAARRYRGC
jgi:dihydroxycyclohexadiene carboxylate dehydrogenase